MARSTAPSIPVVTTCLAGFVGVLLLPLVLGMSAPRGEAQRRAATYADCRERFGDLVFKGKSPEWKEASKAKLRIIPFAKSDEGNTIDELHMTRKWLGVIINYGTATSTRYEVPANILTPVCIRMEGDGTKARLMLVYPDEHTKDMTFLPCEGDNGRDRGPHADWKRKGTCAKYLAFGAAGDVTILSDQAQIHDILTGSAAWVSCASNGCCRVQP